LTEYESKQGTWSLANNILQGIVGINKRALCVAGSETDTAYSVQALVNQASGTKASVIVFYTEDENFNPIYVECVLDFGAGRLHIDLVDAAQRAIVAEISFSLTLGTAYIVKVEASTYSDGTGYVRFLVNGVVQLYIEDLAAIFTAGMAGFACEGILITDGATFANIVIQSLVTAPPTPEAFVTVENVIAHLNAAGPDVNNNYTVYGLTIAEAAIQAHIDHATTYINGLIGSNLNPSDAKYPIAKVAVLEMACLRALVVSSGGSLVGAYDYFLGDLRVTRAAPYASALQRSIEDIKADLKRQIVNLSTAVKTADASVAGNVPTYRGGLTSP
jgi:hypothetical protein